MKQATSKLPRIRFKRYSDMWVSTALKDLSSLITKGTTPLEKVGIGSVNFIKIENINGLTGKITIKEKISESQHQGYLNRSQLRENDILFSIAGTLGRVTVVHKKILPANINQALAIIRLSEGDVEYIATYLKGMAVKEFVRKNPTISAQPNLSLEQIRNLEVIYQSNPEQKKIGCFFRELDGLSALNEQKYEKLLILKKTMLLKMFPKIGESIPEVRFKGFTDKWEQRKMGEIFLPIPNNTLSRAHLNNRAGRVKNIHYGDILVKYGEVLNVQRSTIPYISDDSIAIKYESAALLDGDIIIADAAEDETVGKCTEIQGIADELVVAGLHTIALRPVKIFAPSFLGYYINSNAFHRQLFQIMQGTKVLSITKTGMRETRISFPRDQAEQQKIGSYFQKIDDLIYDYSFKLEKYKQIKAACLQQMLN